jgi:hypothetical protein
MLKRVLTLAIISALAAPVAAQKLDTWKVRVDRSTDAKDPDDTPDLKVVSMGKGVRITGGPAGVFWSPTDTVSGNYTIRATFNLQQPSNHTNYYGLVFGGADLDNAKQTYTYFVVAQNGTLQIRHRAPGAEPTNVLGRTQHASIVQPAAGGQSTNRLEVRVAGDTITYVVNGQTVHTMPKGTMKTDGLVGVRVNHMLDVQVEGFEIVKG